MVSGILFGLVLVSPMNRTRRTAGWRDCWMALRRIRTCSNGTTATTRGSPLPRSASRTRAGRSGRTLPQRRDRGAGVAARARNVIDRALAAEGDVALVSHGHYLRVLCATWLHLAPQHGADFMLSTGTACLLG